MGERRLRDRPAGEYRLAAGPELQQETDGGIDRSEVRDSPWNPLAGNRSRDCLELASRKPSWPAAKSDRINRPDIWMQAIRSDHQELLQHGGRPHMDSGPTQGCVSRNDEDLDPRPILLQRRLQLGVDGRGIAACLFHRFGPAVV